MAFIMVTTTDDKDAYYNIDCIESVTKDNITGNAKIWLSHATYCIETKDSFDWIVQAIKDRAN